MSEQHYLSGFRASITSQAIRIVVNGLVILLLTRHFFSSDEYGLLFLSISIFGSTLVFSRLGIPKSAARYVTEYQETAPDQVRNILRTSFIAIVVTTAIVSTFLFLSRGAIATVFNEPALVPLLGVGFFYVVFRSMNSYFTAIFQGFNQISKSAFITICSNVGLLVGILTLVALDYGVVGALMGYVIGYGLGTAVGFVLLYTMIPEFPTARTESGLRRRILEYSIPLTATNGANVLYKRVDTILIGIFLTPAAVGYYTLAKQLSDFVVAPAHSLGFTISPSYGEHKANDDSHQAARIYEKAFEHTMLFYVPAAAGLALLASPTIGFIFGDDYSGAIPVVEVFAGFIVLQAINSITNDGLDFLGRARHRAIVKTITGILNFCLNLALIPVIGVIGAAISTVISFGIMVAINVYLIHSELELALTRLARSVLLIGGITICMSVVVTVLLPFISNLVTLLSVILIGGTVWAFLAIASGIPEIDVGVILS